MGSWARVWCGGGGKQAEEETNSSLPWVPQGEPEHGRHWVCSAFSACFVPVWLCLKTDQQRRNQSQIKFPTGLQQHGPCSWGGTRKIQSQVPLSLDQEIQTQMGGTLRKGRSVLILSPQSPNTHSPYVKGYLLFSQVLRKAEAAILTQATLPKHKFKCINTYKEDKHHYQAFHKHSLETQTDPLSKGITEQFIC